MKLIYTKTIYIANSKMFQTFPEYTRPLIYFHAFIKKALRVIIWNEQHTLYPGAVFVSIIY